MDGTRFDAWTRRRFGLAAGSLVASLLGSLTFEAPAAGKKRRKRRCKKLGRLCTPGKRKCCGDLRCRTTTLNAVTDTFCCQTEGKPCQVKSDCCGEFCCSPSGICGSLCISDRNRKANFGTVDPADMLQRVRELPISTWNYDSDDPAVRHIGPMAQDFAATFGVGADDRHIHPLDGQGVALAAIQGLLSQLQDLRDENARLAARVARLKSATWSSLLVRGASSVAQYRN